MSRGRRVAIRNLTEASLDDVPVNQLGLEERRNEGAVLLPKCAELCDAQVLLIQAPTGEDRLPSRRRRVGALHLDQSLAPALRYGRRLQVDTVNAEPWSSSNGENSPATPSMMSARRAVSSLSSAIGSTSTSSDIVASAGS